MCYEKSEITRGQQQRCRMCRGANNMHIYCSAPTSHEGGVRDHREQYLQEGVEYEVATVKELGASQFCSQLNAAFSSSRMRSAVVGLGFPS